MSKICPLFSGSTGNSTYISYEDKGILIDVGMSCKSVLEALENAGGSIEEIRAIAITHEHTDHIKGLKALLKKSNASLLASEQTLETLMKMDIVPPKTQTIALDENGYCTNGILINRFATSHDCEGSSGYNVILPDGKKISVCTDLGVVTDEVRTAISSSDVLLLESNHDIEMLKKGPYPPQTKLRILSNKGHISNMACAAELKALLKGGTERFILGHLSLNNNTPLLALSSAEASLMDIGAQNGKDYLLKVAGPKNNGVTVI
ncbi:MAG: MBL fold metallo-hydrolase [Clostridia bacterium]|nr:MBL fold metallo-hydrolase [Clostridia bacterium]